MSARCEAIVGAIEIVWKLKVLPATSQRHPNERIERDPERERKGWSGLCVLTYQFVTLKVTAKQATDKPLTAMFCGNPGHPHR